MPILPRRAGTAAAVAGSFAAALWGAGCRDASAGRIEAQVTGAVTARIGVPAEARWCPAAGRLEITGIRGDTGVGLVVFPGDSLRIGSYAVELPADGAAADSLPADSLRADTTRADTTRADTTRAGRSRTDTIHADTLRADTTRADTTRPDSAAVDTARADTSRYAVVALRWYGGSAVQGYQADSGSVELERAGPGGVEARLRVRLRATASDSIARLAGRVRAPLVVGGAPCEPPRDSAAGATAAPTAGTRRDSGATSPRVDLRP